MSNQNIRSLLRAELSTRRITHPHASYANSKSSLLSCTVCHLVIKSESLWEGHLRSANHRRNVQRLQQGQQESGGANGEVGRGVSGGGARKRKADSMDEDGRHGDDTGLDEAGAINGGGGGGGGGAGRKRKAEDDVEEDGTGDGRKKTKAGDLPPSPPRPPPLSPTSHGTMAGFVPASTSAPPSTASDDAEAIPATEAPSRPPDAQHAIPIPTPIPTPHPTAPSPAINEDEYAAFEREVLPLTTATHPRHHATITISAAPVSASELAAQKAATVGQKQNAVRSREEEAEAEREEEGRRMEQEFEVQEEMERRVRRLREARERIRLIGKRDGVDEGGVGDGDGGGIARGGERTDAGTDAEVVKEAVHYDNGNGEDEGDDDDDDDDDTDEFDGWGVQ